MTEKRFTYFKSKIGFGKQGIDDNLKGYTFDFTMDNVLDCMNDLSEENEQLKKQIEEYTNPDKYILIKKTESSTEEYNSCPDCQHYEREYEEIIAFGEYETLTKEICNKGHDIEDTDANKCNDYEYNEF